MLTRVRRLIPRTVVALAFVVLVVAAGVAAPVAAASGADESASFEDNYLVVTRGDSVDITVSHSSWRRSSSRWRCSSGHPAGRDSGRRRGRR